ncbi:MAG: creatininase family protein [Phycisphaeraceae bacterium]
MANGILQEMTIEQVRAFDPQVAIVCIASTEPHGPHLPYGTDFFSGDAICRHAVVRANERGARVLMYPTIPVGNNVNFKQFPFACRMRVRTLMLLVLDVIEALEEDGIRKIVLLNSHGGNTDTLRAVLREHVDRQKPTEQGERAFVCMINGFEMESPEAAAKIEHASDHAGESETSLMMHLQPELVREEKLTSLPMHGPDVAALRELPVHFVRPWHRYMPRSGGGELGASTAEKGKALLDSRAEHIAQALADLSQAKWSTDFPYADRT